MTASSRGRPLKPLPTLPPVGMTLPELQTVERLQDLYDAVQALRQHPLDEPTVDSPGRTYRAQARVWVETAAEKHLQGHQRAALRINKERLESWLTVLMVYVEIGCELDAHPKIRARVAQWATVRDALAMAPTRTKNRWTKRRSRPATLPLGAPPDLLRSAAASFDEFRRRVLLEREIDELPGANWETALLRGVDAIVADLGTQPVPPRFVSTLLANIQALPGCPPLPSAATVKKRLHRLREML
jgi:hypothetical protein